MFGGYPGRSRWLVVIDGTRVMLLQDEQTPTLTGHGRRTDFINQYLINRELTLFKQHLRVEGYRRALR